MRFTLVLCLVVCVVGIAHESQADVVLSPGTVIIFGDGSMQSTAASGGSGTAPADHGGVNSTVTGTNAFVGGGLNNSATHLNATVSGGRNNTAGARYGTVGGGQRGTVTGNHGTVGGGYYNIVAGEFGTIAGGGPSDPVENPSTTSNAVYEDYGTIAGGSENTVGTDDEDTNAERYGTIGGGSENTTGGYYSTVIGGFRNTASQNYSTVSGGRTNTASGWSASVVGGKANTASGNYAMVGGNNNTASGYRAVVAGGATNTNSGNSGVIGGGFQNEMTGFSNSGVIGGGSNNFVDASYAVVSGGDPYDPTNASTTNNNVYDKYGVIGGGGGNTAGDDDGDREAQEFATVAGGRLNTAGASFASIGGGDLNSITKDWATISGGRSNFIGGMYSAIPGGYSNSVTGDYSFAAGRDASVSHSGSFVWADSTDAEFSSSAANQLAARVSGGVKLYTKSDLSLGAELAANATSWSTLSDRNVKENFRAVDAQEVLEKVANMPIETYNYKGADTDVRHIGVMAQDWSAAFDLGDDARRITTQDADGVALASIQALHQMIRERDDILEQLSKANDELRARIDQLEKSRSQ